MKAFIFILSIALISCGPAKKTSAEENANNSADSTAVPDVASADTSTGRPLCIDSLIAVFKEEKVQNPPRKIYSYTYKGNTVYYVPAICCDFFSDLYDTNCKLIGHPDGGFTGKGDGKLPDFNTGKSNEVLIWADKRAR